MGGAGAVGATVISGEGLAVAAGTKLVKLVKVPNLGVKALKSNDVLGMVGLGGGGAI